MSWTCNGGSDSWRHLFVAVAVALLCGCGPAETPVPVSFPMTWTPVDHDLIAIGGERDVAHALPIVAVRRHDATRLIVWPRGRPDAPEAFLVVQPRDPVPGGGRDHLGGKRSAKNVLDGKRRLGLCGSAEEKDREEERPDAGSTA